MIREYIDTVTPVSSKALVEKYNLGFSSATARNEMVALTESGYLRQPHTSAGREPTEEGYRYFVQRIVGENELPLAERRTISHQFYQARKDVDEWMRLAASVLAQHARGASLVTAPQQMKARFKHLELIATQGRLVLLVLVLHGGKVRQQMLTLAESPSQASLSEAATQSMRVCYGLDSRGHPGPLGEPAHPGAGSGPADRRHDAQGRGLWRRRDFPRRRDHRAGRAGICRPPIRPARRCGCWKSAATWKSFCRRPCRPPWAGCRW